MPAGFKTDFPLTKDKPISSSCSAPGIGDLMRGKSLQAHSRREEWEHVRETALQTPRRSERRSSRLWSWVSPTAQGEEHYEGSCPLAAHESPWGSRDSLAVHGGPHAGAGECLKKDVTPWEPTLEKSSGSTFVPTERAHAGAGFMVGLVTPHGTYGGAICSWRTAWKGPHLSEELQPMGNTLEKFMENCPLWEESHGVARQQCEQSSPEERRSSRN